jgi:hypothetical protein
VSLETNFSAGQAAFPLGVKQIVLKEIRSKWSKFAKDDLSGLKNKDDLATRCAAKYGLEKSATRRDVDALMSGRQILPERARTTLDYNAPAELFPPRLRKSPHRRFGYRRFARAGDAVRFAIEELPPELLLGAVLEVDGERYCGEDIHRCSLIAPTLHKQIENLAFVVDRSPEPESPAGDQNRHLVQMPA